MMVSVGRSRPAISLAYLLLFAILGCFRASSQTAGSNAQVADHLVHTLCGKRVALLGENPIHGFGRTLAFKAELVRRLVDECHYNAFFIEAGSYDFIHIQDELNAGREITDAEVSTAIGGLWANQEVQSLVPFLRDRLTEHRLLLGGLDDQINRATYAQTSMPADWVKTLPPAEQAECLDRLQQHMPWHYNPDQTDTPEDKANIVTCIGRMQASLPPQAARTKAQRGTAAALENLQRNFARERAHDLARPGEQAPWMNEREQSMYLNFRWWLSQLPPRSKVIVWSATVHTAKKLSTAAGFETRVPLGSYIKKDFGKRAFSLGFSAASGSYWIVRPPAKQLAVAPADSLEGNVFASTQADVVYLSGQQLRAHRSIAARPLGINFTSALWDEVLDGIIIFREERAPTLLKP